MQSGSHTCAPSLADGSGFITFDEWRRAIRGRLRVPPSTLSEDRIKALWCAMAALQHSLCMRCVRCKATYLERHLEAHECVQAPT